MNSGCFEEANLQALVEKVAKDEGFQKPHYSISNASRPGQNFTGRIFRVVIWEKIEGQDKTRTLIIKASSTNLARQEKLGGGKLFCTESQMYQIVFPTLNAFLRKHNIADGRLFPGIPRCVDFELNYGTGNKLADILILEDKQEEGFQIVDFKTGLSEEQCRLAIEKVALLHATSMAINELEPITSGNLKYILDKSYKLEEFQDIFTEMYRLFLKGLAMLGDPYEPGHPVYDKLYKDYDGFCNDYNDRVSFCPDLYCIAHTDLTCNNILFKLKPDGSTKDACLIDFQTAAVTSPANDLASLLLFCTKKSVRDKHFDELLDFYYKEVRRILVAFGCDPDKIFPLTLFQEHLKRYMRFGVVTSLVALQIMLADPSEFTVIDIHSSQTDDKIVFTSVAEIKNPKTLKKLRKRLCDAVADAVSYGYL